MKLWDKGKAINKQVEKFTTGHDRELDLLLAPFDILGSIAHARMLASTGLLKNDEAEKLAAELKNLYEEAGSGRLVIEEGVEDIHSLVELRLTQKLGAVGKKIHSGRSRNDQVLVDLKMFMREKIREVAGETEKLFEVLIEKSEKHKDKLLPGYTHMQLAMPSSFGLWFGSYAESLVDDVISLHAAYRIVNKNPLGSGAGFGSSLPLDRQLTTTLLAFDDLNHNSAYAQTSRGKSEKAVAFALASAASTLAKFAMDVCLYMNQNFGFISFPEELTTGSSIMPHKKNPDVFELVRAKCNSLQALPNEISLIHGNLISGYHRDYQIVKEHLFPAFQTLVDCMSITRMMLEEIVVKDRILDNEKYSFLFSVEEVNKLVLSGVPFREAYQKVAEEIQKGTYSPSKKIDHSHEGSIGNLNNDKIKANMKEELARFQFEKIDQAIRELLS